LCAHHRNQSLSSCPVDGVALRTVDAAKRRDGRPPCGVELALPGRNRSRFPPGGAGFSFSIHETFSLRKPDHDVVLRGRRSGAGGSRTLKRKKGIRKDFRRGVRAQVLEKAHFGRENPRKSKTIQVAAVSPKSLKRQVSDESDPRKTKAFQGNPNQGERAFGGDSRPQCARPIANSTASISAYFHGPAGNSSSASRAMAP
jgi:hypothetical protein